MPQVAIGMLLICAGATCVSLLHTSQTVRSGAT
jgi:hypothetical protein